MNFDMKYDGVHINVFRLMVLILRSFRKIILVFVLLCVKNVNNSKPDGEMFLYCIFRCE